MPHPMKRIFQLTLAGLVLSVALLAGAGTYQDGDVLLIFREAGFNDVEFDLGDISQFLNHANGYTTPVTGWSLAKVATVFGSDLTGVSVIVAATQARTNLNRLAWVSSVNPGVTVNDVTASAWQGNLWSIINSLGTRPLIYQVPPFGSGWAYSIDPNGTYKLAAYDNIVSGNGVNGSALAQFGGNTAFTVEGAIPATLGFWQIQGTNEVPKPAAAYIGTFAVNAAGNLTFTAGPPQPEILAITRAGGVNTVTFTTVPAGSYSLVYSSTLTSPVSTWSTVSGPVSGTGDNQSLSHTIAGSAGYYGVVHTP
jgi:hypothetical protein